MSSEQIDELKVKKRIAKKNEYDYHRKKRRS